MRSSTMTTISSAGLRSRTLRLTRTDGAGSRRRTERAWAPRRPSAMLNSIRWPPLRPATPSGRALAGTKTSPSPASPDTKPKPFSESKNFTLPVGTVHLFVAIAGPRPVRAPPTRLTARTGACSRVLGGCRPPPPSSSWAAEAPVNRSILSVDRETVERMAETTEDRAGSERDRQEEPVHELTLRGFWNALPRPGRLLLSTTAVSTLGRGMTLPFTIIYVHEVRGISLDVAGLLMGLIAMVAPLLTPPVGAPLHPPRARGVV